MGLDQGLYKYKKSEKMKDILNEEIKESYEDFAKREIGYWRKRYGVHDYFSSVFHSKKKNKGIRYEGQPVRIRMKDIKKFEKLNEDKHSIIFSGDSYWSGDRPWTFLRNENRKIIKKAKKILNNGFKIYYLASW